MGQIKHKMGNVGGGVDISHKSKMSGKAKSLMSFPGGMPGPGNYGSSDNNVVGKGMGKYLAGESVGMAKYKHKGAAQMDPMHNGKAGVQQEDFEQFSAPDSTGPAKKTDRIDKRKARQEKRAEKRVNRGEKRSDKLQKRIDKTTDTVLKAKREARKKKRDDKVTMNKKAVSKDFVSDKDKKSNQKVQTATDELKKLDFKSTLGAPKYDDGPMKTDPKKETLGARAVRIKAEKKATKLEKRTTKSSAGDIKAKARKLSALNKSRAKAKQRILTAKENNVYGKGPKKTDPVVVKGDKSKVNNKITKTNTKAKKIALLKEQKAIKSAQAKEKIKEKRNMIQVKRDLEKNKRNQKIRKRDGKDYQANTGTDNQKTVRRS